MPSFSELPLLPTLLESLEAQGLTAPTDIQAQTVQPLLDDRSVLGVAETGSGKTLAYVLPLLHKLKTLENGGSSVSEPGKPRGLVLVPGRELGEQVSKVFKTLTHSTRLRVRVALGGSKKKVARQSVAGNFEVLVATPGRLIQLLDGDDLHLDDVRTVIFDEADQMVDPGFLPVAQRILGDCPNAVQVAMFSATLSQRLDAVVSSLFPSNPVRIRTSGSQRLVPTLKTENVNIINGQRREPLIALLREQPAVGTMLFMNTREQLDKVAEWLAEAGIPATSYRGQMDRLERRANLARFRDGEVAVLLATDLGGRGLDIERVGRVINVHLPQDIDNYLHRVGRTARAGRSGLVVNLVTQRDQPLLARLRKREEKAARRSGR
ncbi:MAG: DEAD/DEAH box helicase [Proteobacteria bacterium]|nr:DEAD/DEAH box helicase [Pseudomonadota bacterium]